MQKNEYGELLNATRNCKIHIEKATKAKTPREILRKKISRKQKNKNTWSKPNKTQKLEKTNNNKKAENLLSGVSVSICIYTYV